MTSRSTFINTCDLSPQQLIKKHAAGKRQEDLIIKLMQSYPALDDWTAEMILASTTFLDSGVPLQSIRRALTLLQQADFIHKTGKTMGIYGIKVTMYGLTNKGLCKEVV
jgi:Fe2+ or Zn2+ uptake regulation protein